MAVSRAKMGSISVFSFLLILTHNVTCLDSDILDLPQNLQTLLGKENETKVDNRTSEVQETQENSQNKPEDAGDSRSDQLLTELKKGLAMEKQSRVILEETVNQLKRRFLAGQFNNLDETGTDVLSKRLEAFNRILETERINGVNLEVKFQQLENRQKTVTDELEAERTRSANLKVKVQLLENSQKAVNEELDTERTRSANLDVKVQDLENRHNKVNEKLNVGRTRSEILEVKVQQLENRQKKVNEELDIEKSRRANIQAKVQQQKKRQKIANEELNVGKTYTAELEMAIRQVNNTLLSLKNDIPQEFRKIIEKMVVLKAGRGGVTVCPFGWSLFGSFCYYFQLRKELVTGYGAARKCKEKHAGSTLVFIETEDEYNFLKNTLKEHYGSVRSHTGNGWMTSGKHVNGGYEWSVTGDRLNLSAVRWNTGRPRALGCVSLYPPTFDMSDAFCDKFWRQFICKLALRNT